jgi:hypothetical protein
MFEFMPAIGAILISNNDGKWFNSFVKSGTRSASIGSDGEWIA